MYSKLYGIFCLFENDDKLTDSLNMVKYRYGIIPHRYVEFYEDIIKYLKGENQNNIVQKYIENATLYLDFINDQSKHDDRTIALLLTIDKIIADIQLSILNLDGTISNLKQRDADSLFIIVKSMLQMIFDFYSKSENFKIKSTHIAKENLDAKTITSKYKASFLYSIFEEDYQTKSINSPLTTITCLAPLIFSTIKNSNTSIYKDSYNCRWYKNDGMYNLLDKSCTIEEMQDLNTFFQVAPHDISLTRLYNEAMKNCSEKISEGISECIDENSSDREHKLYSVADMNSFYDKFCSVYSAVYKTRNKLWFEHCSDLIDEDKEKYSKCLLAINNFLVERIYHFNFYRKLANYVKKDFSEIELDVNKMLCLSVLENIFFIDPLIDDIKNKTSLLTTFHTKNHNDNVDANKINYDSSLLALCENVNYLNMIYYPIIFTLLTYVIKEKNITIKELQDVFITLSNSSDIEKHLHEINLTERISTNKASYDNIPHEDGKKKNSDKYSHYIDKLIEIPKSSKQIEQLMNQCFYIVKNRYYGKHGLSFQRYMDIFSNPEGIIHYPRHLIPSMLPHPAYPDSDEYNELRKCEIKDKFYAQYIESNADNSPSE